MKVLRGEKRVFLFFSAMAAANYHSSRLASSQWIAIYHSAISRLLNTQDTSV